MSEYVALLEDYKRDWDWFTKHYDELVENLDGQYVAVFTEKAIDHDENLDKLLNRLRRKYPVDKLIIEYVSKKKLQFVL